MNTSSTVNQNACTRTPITLKVTTTESKPDASELCIPVTLTTVNTKDGIRRQSRRIATKKEKENIDYLLGHHHLQVKNKQKDQV
jgi:hypothetical protein